MASADPGVPPPCTRPPAPPSQPSLAPNSQTRDHCACEDALSCSHASLSCARRTRARCRMPRRRAPARFQCLRRRWAGTRGSRQHAGPEWPCRAALQEPASDARPGRRSRLSVRRLAVDEHTPAVRSSSTASQQQLGLEQRTNFEGAPGWGGPGRRPRDPRLPHPNVTQRRGYHNGVATTPGCL